MVQNSKLTVKVERTFDVDLIKRIWGDERIYGEMRDDGCPKDSANWKPSEDKRKYFLVVYILENSKLIPIGIISYYQLSHAMFEIHIGFLPEYHGKVTVEAVNLANTWIFINTSCEIIVAYVPVIKPHVRRLAQKCGFVENCLLPKSFSTNGSLVDQYLYTLWR
jgi:RimJ/RimL family protein N-acetyltransferase